MTLTENIMEICRVRTEYEIQRYVKHAEFLPEQLTYDTACDIIKNVEWCRVAPEFKTMSEALINLGKRKI